MPYRVISTNTANDMLERINKHAGELRSFRVVCTLRWELADCKLLIWVNDIDAAKL